MNNSLEKFGLHKEKFQVFLFICPSHLPFFFGKHSWFVINEKGSLSRWEVLFMKINRETSWGHLCKDFLPPFQGIGVFPFFQRFFWKAKLLGMVDGEVALKVAKFIKESPKTYPYTDKYLLNGPNCNTYVQWVLDNFPDFKASLPVNSFGKNYKKKKAP